MFATSAISGRHLRHPENGRTLWSLRAYVAFQPPEVISSKAYVCRRLLVGDEIISYVYQHLCSRQIPKAVASSLTEMSGPVHSRTVLLFQGRVLRRRVILRSRQCHAGGLAGVDTNPLGIMLQDNRALIAKGASPRSIGIGFAILTKTLTRMTGERRSPWPVMVLIAWIKISAVH